MLFGRLVPGARSLVSIPAGLSEMPVRASSALTALGSTVWNCALIGAGWALGEHYEQVGGIVGPIGTAVVGRACAARPRLALVRSGRLTGGDAAPTLVEQLVEEALLASSSCAGMCERKSPSSRSAVCLSKP